MRKIELRRYMELTEAQRQNIAESSRQVRRERDEEVARAEEEQEMTKRMAELIAAEVVKRYRKS